MARPRNKIKKTFIPIEKDDGSRWNVIDGDGKLIYVGEGVKKSEAVRLAGGMVQPAGIRQVEQ